jgi:hypothetical protein
MEIYSVAIHQLELQAGKRLQTIFSSLQSQPNQFIREFKKYKDLLQRVSIARYLESEIAIFLGHLSSLLRVIQTNLKSRNLELQEQKGRNISHTINNIIWARQNITKIEDTNTIVTTISGQKEAYESISVLLYKDLHAFETEQFEYWIEVKNIFNSRTHKSLSMIIRQY